MEKQMNNEMEATSQALGRKVFGEPNGKENASYVLGFRFHRSGK